MPDVMQAQWLMARKRSLASTRNHAKLASHTEKLHIRLVTNHGEITNLHNLRFILPWFLYSTID